MRAARAEAAHALTGGRHRVYNLIRGLDVRSLTRSSTLSRRSRNVRLRELHSTLKLYVYRYDMNRNRVTHR